MNLKHILIISSFLLVALLCLGSVVAIEDSNIDYNLTADVQDSNLEIGDDSQLNDNIEVDTYEKKLGSSSDNQIISSPQTIVVPEVEESHQEMGDPTIQTAIDRANPGDTIIINGRDYTHCHIVVDKKLTIISTVGTTMSPCPSNNAESGYYGVFYIAPEASGTVIDGFTIITNMKTAGCYGILVSGASDVEIRNCTLYNIGARDALRVIDAKNTLIHNITAYDAENSINIISSQNTKVYGSVLRNSKYGIRITDSSKTTVTSNIITANSIAGIAFSGNGKDLTVIYNNITNNYNGINLTSSKNINILSNYIAFNTYNGVYVDNDISLIIIKGNFFNQNYYWEIFNDFHVTNLVNDGQELEVVDNNYMINYGAGQGDKDRPIWTQVYDYRPGLGDYGYDAVNDKYDYIGYMEGDYDGHQGIMFIRYVFEINEYMYCPNTHLDMDTVWSQAGNYQLQLSEITQLKKGIYSISIVDENGNIARDISSVPVTFYLNKADESSTPQAGDIYKTVMMQNGTATVRFYQNEFNATGNVITAVFPTPGTKIDGKVSKKLAISDDNIPGIPSNTTIKVSNLNTYPNSNHELIATLTDINGKAISGETLIFIINSKTYNVPTDGNGKAKIKISESKERTYEVQVKYAGDGDIDYYASSAKANVVVKKTNTKIISSNLNMIPKMAEYYSVTLKDASGNVLANQYVTFKVNGRSYTKKTNSKGVASINLKFNLNNKVYKVNIVYKGSNKYRGVSKTNTILVKYSSKKVKLSAPSITIPPSTAKYYTLSLKDLNGKPLIKQGVTVNINGKTYAKLTNSKGQASIKVKFNKMRSYRVSAIYKGTKVYAKASSKGIIKVDKTATKITAPTISTTPKETKTYTVTLKANNKALAKQKLTISVNGKTYAKTTNGKGQASVSVNFNNEKSYNVNVVYKGTGIYKASKATGKINVAKVATQIESYDRTYSKNGQKDYQMTLKDSSGNALPNQAITFNINRQSYSKTTDANGKATFNLNELTGVSFTLEIKYAGSYKYKPSSKTNMITISNKTSTVFIDSGLPNSEIQNILDNSADGSSIEFLGNSYSDVSLNINKPLNIFSNSKTVLNAKAGSVALRISANDVNVTDLVIRENSGNAICIINSEGVSVLDNVISNNWDGSKMESYADGSIMIPGYGVLISNSKNVNVFNNNISSFESGIFLEQSSGIVIDNNMISENNYGIKYGFGVANTQISNNEIFNGIGLVIMTIPEGPTGYGIFLNNSAVNVTINKNHIYNNFIGISVDSNYSTGINITQNTISDQILEGIRFNAGYDLAENAVEPYVEDNAIYRNARGPSMMILGEMSANPFGIYGGGLYNDSQKLKIGPNWYGANQVVTWDNDTGKTGYGTMCPRIKTTEILFRNITYNNGAYEVVFYKDDGVASNLPEFDLYATLNRGTDKQAQVIFNIVNGRGSFSFDSSNYNGTNNVIEISVGSLIYSTSRVFKVTYEYMVPQNETKLTP